MNSLNYFLILLSQTAAVQKAQRKFRGQISPLVSQPGAEAGNIKGCMFRFVDGLRKNT